MDLPSTADLIAGRRGGVPEDATLCGIVLHPAGHTRSPAMHRAAFQAMGLRAAYVAFDVPPEQLEAALAGARAARVRQLAVSIPHKERVIGLLDHVDETAREIGAVNTVTRDEEGRLGGANTDWLGLVDALERETPLDGRHAVVLGAGGTARAAVYGLRARGARVTVLNRTRARADALAEAFGVAAGALEALADLSHDVLVNTTSVGLRSAAAPVPAAHLRPGTVVFDAVYDPPRTRLLRDAEAAGCRTVGGKWMLVGQAVAQVRLWTGRDAPAEVMARAFDEAGA